jgi:hypothetical protein
VPGASTPFVASIRARAAKTTVTLSPRIALTSAFNIRSVLKSTAVSATRHNFVRTRC